VRQVPERTVLFAKEDVVGTVEPPHVAFRMVRRGRGLGVLLVGRGGEDPAVGQEISAGRAALAVADAREGLGRHIEPLDLIRLVAGALRHEDELLAVVGEIGLGMRAVAGELADVAQLGRRLRRTGATCGEQRRTAREEKREEKWLHGDILRTWTESIKDRD